MMFEVGGAFSLMGNKTEFDAAMVAARLGESRVMPISDGMIYLSTQYLGIDAGIDKLMELASLPAITRAVPATERFVFDESN